MKANSKEHFALAAALLVTPALLCGLIAVCVIPILFYMKADVNQFPTASPPPVLTDPAKQQHTGPIQPHQKEADNVRLGSMATLYRQLNPGVVNIQIHKEERGFRYGTAGAGFILDDNGHVVTNYHVVKGADWVTVIYYNEFETKGEIIGADIVSDLAIIKVDGLADGARPLLLGDSSEVAVGDWAIAIGNPLGQRNSLSVGVISGVNRIIPSLAPDYLIPGVIQTDADLNLGSSGGPLFNARGEVIGLNSQIATGPMAGGPAVGLAIPINLVRQVASELIENGTYRWPWLGAQGRNVNLTVMQANNLESQQGIYIENVIPGSPADKAGLAGTSRTEKVNGILAPLGGDVIMAADDQELDDFNDLLIFLMAQQPDHETELTILRDGQFHRVVVKLEPRVSELIAEAENEKETER